MDLIFLVSTQSIVHSKCCTLCVPSMLRPPCLWPREHKEGSTGKGTTCAKLIDAATAGTSLHATQPISSVNGLGYAWHVTSLGWLVGLPRTAHLTCPADTLALSAWAMLVADMQAW